MKLMDPTLPQRLQIAVSTKMAEGAMLGIKFSFLWAVIYAPYESKARALECGGNRMSIYLRYVGRTTLFFPAFTGVIFGMI